MKNMALVIFVKTVGFSPVKTRLGASIGTALAESFYQQSLKAIADVANLLTVRNPELTLYWAVAEKEALRSPQWSQFEVIWQGEGKGLGERLSHVYSELITKHNGVCFIGGDSPHIPASDYEIGLLKLKESNLDTFILGNTLDGGFYFFGGKKEIQENLWTEVEYSQKTTAADLSFKLSMIGTVETIKVNFDIDELSDLQRYAEIDLMREDLLPVQKEIIKWGRAKGEI